MQKVEVNFDKKLATVEYEPGKATLSDLIAALMHTNKYKAELSEAVVTSQVAEGVNFEVTTDQATYAPEGTGKILVKAEQPASSAAPKMQWTVTGDEGLVVTPKGSDLLFQVKKDAKKTELLAHVKITLEGAKGKVELDLPAVVIVAKK